MNQATQEIPEIRVKLYRHDGSNNGAEGSAWHDEGTGLFSYIQTEETHSYLNNYETGLMMVIIDEQDG